MATSEKPITTKPAHEERRRIYSRGQRRNTPTARNAALRSMRSSATASAAERGAATRAPPRRATSPPPRGGAGAAPAGAAGPSGARAAAVLFFVVLPIAVAIGVLVGKGNGGGNNNDQQLADALKSLQASGGGGTALASTAAATPITSDFTLDQGYTVELKTLPVDGTDQAAVDAAKKAATDQGAADVGIINTSEFAVTPAPPANTYVLYSGQFKTQGRGDQGPRQAQGQVQGRPGRLRQAELGRPGPAGRQDAYGDVHQVEGFTPTRRRSPRTRRWSSSRPRRSARTTSTRRRTCPM